MKSYTADLTYSGITTVMVSMHKYETKAFHKFQHTTPRRSQYAPHQWMHTNYGATKQLVDPLDN